MTVSPQTARKQIFQRILDCWSANAGDILSPIPELRFQGLELSGIPGATSFWARASTQLVTTRQAAHAMPEAPDGSNVVYETHGLVFLQIFAPMKNPEAWAKGELLAQVGQRMFMASETSSAVWFRNPRMVELQNDGTWYRWNVIAEYQFNQTKKD